MVVREPCFLFQTADWQENPRGANYLASLFPGFTHSYHLELGFNDCRDNEIRGARHKQRKDGRVQAHRGAKRPLL